ncbi:hypothetical protein DUNSADRAFT_2497 [Dunaliella salina]|uniref:DUF4281 domain-containing protein n=1 Tax=Dunaliella salina TaxID=3046 RepID=A0ABQ7FW88_DUNSA|nr:hypothetical protein DUNSADRAFT_2497 [Dunaliella salina]|eukprot:KAF5826630.1 hypothetical protein DUNSADRAFT_2497 [Dunaliella salina]
MPLPFLPQVPDEQLFQTVNLVIPCWIMLAIFPNNKMTKLLVILSSLFFCALYASLLIPMIMDGGVDFKDFMSLQGVAKAFSTYRVVLPSWVHFCVFDLWVGQYIADDAWKRNVPRILTAPMLFLNMMAGPVGLGTYLLVRAPLSSVFSKPKRA